MTSTLWAPWRMAYIGGARPEGCPLCQIPRDGIDRAKLILHRGPHTYVVLNLYPYNNGHLLVAPRTHKGRLDELTLDNLQRICS